MKKHGFFGALIALILPVCGSMNFPAGNTLSYLPKI
jgi:hypothetical protein